MCLDKLDPSGNALYRNPLVANVKAIALAHNLVYVSRYTYSDGLPITAGAIEPTPDPNGDAFVAVLDLEGNILYATYLGGDAQHERAMAITVDQVGYA